MVCNISVIIFSSLLFLCYGKSVYIMSLDHDNSGRRMLISICHKLWLQHDEDMSSYFKNTSWKWWSMMSFAIPFFFFFLFDLKVWFIMWVWTKILNCLVSRKKNCYTSICQFFISIHYVIVQMGAQNNTKTAGGKLSSTLGTFKPEPLFSVMCMA